MSQTNHDQANGSVRDEFWNGAEAGPFGIRQKRLTVPTYDPEGQGDKEYDWSRPDTLTVQEDLGLRIVMGDPGIRDSPDVAIERYADGWRIFVHADSGDPLCVIEITSTAATVETEMGESLLTRERGHSLVQITRKGE